MITKDQIRSMLIKNELSGITEDAYKITDLNVADSGFSFGQAQWDLSEHNDPKDIYYTTFNNILLTATDSNGNRILGDTDVDDIMKKVIKKDGNISQYESRINQALQSTYGRQQIDQVFDSYLNVKITRLNNLIDEVRDAGNGTVADYIANNSVLQMMLIDYDNQLSINGVDSPGNFTSNNDGNLLQYLKTGQTTFERGNKVNVDGSFDVADYLKFLFETKHAETYENNFSGAKDLLRRFFNIISEARCYSTYNLTAEEEKTINQMIGLFSFKLRNSSDNQTLLDKIRSLFTTAEAVIPPASPIILDLDGDGVETTGVTAGAYFDHDGNGFAEQTGWAGADDGILKDRQMAKGEGLKAKGLFIFPFALCH